MPAHTAAGGAAIAILLISPMLVLAAYVTGAVLQTRRGRPWPWHRTVAFTGGVAAATWGFIAPIAGGSGDFAAHAVAHAMVGMLAPLLLVLAAPVTLALRCLHVTRARRVSRVLRSLPVRVVGHPVTAGLLSVGGMWVLYFSPLYAASERSLVIHFLVMGHTLAAGYLFTAALISLDPAPHRSGFPMRMGVLVVALAAHAVLTKLLYADGVPGVTLADARIGAMVMYYAGDAVDAALAVILCAQWYRAAGRRQVRPALRAT